MHIAFILVACMLTAGEPSRAPSEGLLVSFQLPEDIEDAQGVELRVQSPKEVRVLLKPEPDSSTWYMPVAALPAADRPQKPWQYIWYQRVEKSRPEYLDQRVLCLGRYDYEKGEWTLPELNSEPLPWGGPNNVVMRRSPHKPTWGGFNQHQIVRLVDGYRMVYWDQPAEQGEAGAMLATSKDGIQWEKDPRGTVFTEHNDAFTLLPVGDEFWLYQTKLEDWPDKPYPDNLDKFRRVQSLRVSKDLVTWTPQEVILRPDDQDPPETEFYLMRPFRYGYGLRYAAILMKYFGDPNNPNKHSAIIRHELMFSDDARTWKRPYRGTDIGFFSFAQPFTDSGALCFASWKDSAITLVRYRYNGLVGVVAEGDGSFITPPVKLPQGLTSAGFSADIDAPDGWAEFEVLAADKTPLPGLSPVRVESPAPHQILRFDSPPAAWPETVRFRVRLHHATLYGLTPGFSE